MANCRILWCTLMVPVWQQRCKQSPWRPLDHLKRGQNTHAISPHRFSKLATKSEQWNRKPRLFQHVEELETLPAGTKPWTLHHQVRGRERVKRGSAWQSSLEGQERTFINETNIRTISKTKEMLWKHLRDRVNVYGLFQSYRYHPELNLVHGWVLLMSAIGINEQIIMKLFLCYTAYISNLLLLYLFKYLPLSVLSPMHWSKVGKEAIHPQSFDNQ